MSMRKGSHGSRNPRHKADELARFLAQNSIALFHQKRNLENKCTTCWDEYGGDYSPACTDCAGSGFVVITSPNANLPRKRGYVSFTQPYGNFGNSGQVFKAGGQHTRYSAYITMDKNTGKDVERGDRIIVKTPGLKNEFVVLNCPPIMAGIVPIGYNLECATASNIVLEEVIG